MTDTKKGILMAKDDKKSVDIVVETEDTPKPKRRSKTTKADSAPSGKTTKKRAPKKAADDPSNTKETIIREAYLEFVENENGALVLREVGGDEALVSIDFADKIKEMLGKETIQVMSHHMIQAAIASFMQHQMNQWHAHVHEETPKHLS